MGKSNFDKLDSQIMKLLSENARKAFLEIARECGISGAAIHQRVQKLLQTGVLQGFETCINPQAVGYDTCAYIGFFLSDPKTIDEAVKRLKELPSVVECHTTTGRYDLILKVYARNNEHLRQIIVDDLQEILPGRSETLISFKEEFRRQAPINPAY